MNRFLLLLAFGVYTTAVGFASPTPGSAPNGLQITVDSIHEINCLYATGYIKVSAKGGAAPYTYHWNTGVTGPVLSGIPVGD
jgi:hypothetical protein